MLQQLKISYYCSIILVYLEGYSQHLHNEVLELRFSICQIQYCVSLSNSHPYFHIGYASYYFFDVIFLSDSLIFHFIGLYNLEVELQLVHLWEAKNYDAELFVGSMPGFQVLLLFGLMMNIFFTSKAITFSLEVIFLVIF